MSLFKKLLVAWKGRAVIAEFSQISKGWKTLPFWIALIGSLITYAGALKDIIPPPYALLVITVLTAFYNILRGVQKSEAPGVRPWYKTTEFWMGAAAQVQNTLIAVHTNGIATTQVMQANIILTGAMAIARDLSNIQPNDDSELLVDLTPPAQPPVKK